MHNVCAVIPVFNHEHALVHVVAALRRAKLPCILVNDASSPACTAVIEELAAQADCYAVHLLQNQGKGGAVMAGLREAQMLGFSHALQVDADGQHNLSDISAFLDCSRLHPDSLICGYPEYDNSVPKGRLYARYLTHVWVWINSLSLQIRDSMCGFRVYPLASTVALINRVKLGKRMDFDPEILVRMTWQNQPIQWLPTHVNYPLDGLSHFRLVHDNLLISKMHAKLFFGMLLRAPLIVWRRWRQ
ncbi:glycosyltransferase family 2 protein [Pseudomonas sp. NPDC078700]|uniref:glycosyltransferase family 2 protein n=1 Tax=Pseudomonas sp. NPDC078700 TaxID=3364424 RepID=UPI0037CC9A72